MSAGAGAPTWGALLSGVAAAAGFGDESLTLLGRKDPRDQATLIERRLQNIGKDLRTEVETSDTQGVLDGDLDQFMGAALAARVGQTRGSTVE